MPMTPTQADFKRFEKLFAKVKAGKKENRKSAIGTLDPGTLRTHLKSKLDLVLPYGTQGMTQRYSYAELQRFAKAMDRVSKRDFAGREKGAPLARIVEASLPIDRKRANQEIRSATLYKVRGGLLAFKVSASAGSKYQFHQVRIRLEEWGDKLGGLKSDLVAAKEAAVGNVAIDCDCGRHQYHYRYLATIGGFAVTPPAEKDFPKIKNPKLQGAACKHVLKALMALRSPSLQVILSKHMKDQRTQLGFGETKTKYLTPEELKKAERIRIKGATDDEVQKAYKDLERARKAFKRKLSERETVEEIKKLKSQTKAMTKILKEKNRDLLVKDLQIHLMGAVYRDGKTRQEAVAAFAKDKGLGLLEVEDMAKDINV